MCLSTGLSLCLSLFHCSVTLPLVEKCLDLSNRFSVRSFSQDIIENVRIYSSFVAKIIVYFKKNTEYTF